jgi:hypothetical protein
VPEAKSEKKDEKVQSKPVIRISKENPLTTSVDSKYEAKEKEKETGATSESQRKPLSFSNLRQSGPTSLSPRLYSSSDPERPYGAYIDKGPYPHFASSLGRSSGGATLEGQQTKSDDKSKGAYY